jgi:2-aminoethylphosphonate transport system permease protein
LLVWTNTSRIVIWSITGLILAIFYVAPFAVILLASLAGQWNGVFPSQMTLEHYADAISGDSGAMLRVSVITAVVASAISLTLGAAAALALRGLVTASARVLDTLFFLPSAVPSVSVGLGLLVAFSRPPLLLNGTIAIVMIAHIVLISAFTYGNVSAGLARMPVDVEQVAESLGARPIYRLRHVTLPMIQPQLIAAFSLSFALSMGELGATSMVYPPGWVTLPVGIFSLTDRGEIFGGAALTVVLIVTTLVVLLGLSAAARTKS